MTSVDLMTALTVSPIFISSALRRDDAFNLVVVHSDDDVSHDSAQWKFFNLAGEFVTSR